jgi:hypothetical protein
MAPVGGGTVKRGAATALVGTSRPDLLLVSEFKQALRQPGCPLCRVIRNADLHYLRVFLREGKDDGRVLLRLLGSWGLCARHASGLVHLEPVEHGDGLGTGTLYDWLLDQARRRLEDLRRDLGEAGRAGSPAWGRPRSPRQRVMRALHRLARTTPCPACEAHERYAEYVVEGLARAMEPAARLPMIQDMYLASEGLCLPHWQAVLKFRPSSGVRELITQKQCEVAALLKAALEADLKRGTAEEAAGGTQKQEPAFARALAAVAGDTTWHPPGGERWPTH